MRTIVPIEENPALREKSRKLSDDEITAPKTRKLIAEMKKLLAQEEYGVALAAVQVGEPVRLFIVSGKALARGARNATDEENGGVASGVSQIKAEISDQIYINPVIEKASRKKTNKHEGCLSIRGKWGQVPRAEKATVQALDERGRAFTRGASGFLAHIFQHEMDHLEGILYTDKAVEMHEEKEKSS